jgi:hypothetical protein
MTGEVEKYSQPTTAVERHQSTAVDSWVAVMGPIIELAEHVHGTDFVPRALRGNAPATAAAMLYGRELGIGPMRSLRTVHMVEGSPTLAAQQMRAMVLAAGHELKYLEHTKARCVVAGRRKGDKEWTTVEWSLQDARDWGLATKRNWRQGPRQMLVARATAELCRMIFADIIGGAYATEEIADGVEQVVLPVPPEVDETPKRRTAQRKTPVKRSAPAAVEPAPAKHEPAPAPPLPGEDEVQDAEVVDEETSPDPYRPVTEPQLTRLHAFFTTHEITDREHKLNIARVIVGRPDLSSSTELTVREAGQLIDTLGQLEAQADNDFPAALAALLREMQTYDEDPAPQDNDTEDDQ